MAHKLKLLRVSGILHQGKFKNIEVWQCQECKKYMILDAKTGKKISLNGKLGEEI
ncbi:MAG: hypothetical protein PVG65_00605 [Candidatus Thorarchaeota archaeon]|jgi:hypothetical protein